MATVPCGRGGGGSSMGASEAGKGGGREGFRGPWSDHLSRAV